MNIKFNKLFFSIIFAFFIAGCDPIKYEKYYKTGKLMNTKFDNFTSYYDLSLNVVEITKKLTVNGKLIAINSKINDLHVNGPSELFGTFLYGNVELNGDIALENVVIPKGAKMYGSVLLTKSNIKGILDITSDCVEIRQSDVANIHIQGGDDIVIKLLEGTSIRGNIVFKKGFGKVLIDKDSRVFGSIYANKPAEVLMPIEVSFPKSDEYSNQ